jgi:hypothetical protein
MRRPVGPVLCVAAAVLTLVGSLQALYSTGYRYGGELGYAFTITGWGLRNDAPVGFGEVGSSEAVPPNGAPLAVAALVLLVAAVLGVRTAPWAGNARIAAASGPVAVIGAALLVGVVGTVGMQELGWLGAAERARAMSDIPGAPELSVEASVGVGFWLLVVASVLAVAAALLTSRRAPVGAAREEPDTPVLGIPVVTRLPDEPPPPASP